MSTGARHGMGRSSIRLDGFVQVLLPLLPGNRCPDANQHGSQIIFRAALETELFQLSANCGQIIVSQQHLPQLVIGNMSGNTVGAKQELGALVNFDDLHINFNGILGPKCTTDNILTGMIRGLLRGHPPGAYFFLYHRMIISLPQQLPCRSQSIQPRVANMSNGRDSSIHVKTNNRGGHH